MRKCVPFTVPKDGFQGEQIPLWLSPVFQIFFFTSVNSWLFCKQHFTTTEQISMEF